MTVELNIILYYVDEEKLEQMDKAKFELAIGELPIKNYSDVYFRKCKSVATMCIFSTMIDYKFRTYHGPKDTVANKQKAKILTLEEYF